MILADPFIEGGDALTAGKEEMTGDRRQRSVF